MTFQSGSNQPLPLAFPLGTLAVGASRNQVGALPIGTNSQVLTADNTQPLGMKWATVTSTTSGGSSSSTSSIVIPSSYVSANPYWNSATQTTLTSFLGADDTNSIMMKSSGFLYFYTDRSNVNGGLVKSALLTGTISSSSGTVTGVGTTFTTDLVVGDTIYVSSVSTIFKVTYISSDTSLLINMVSGVAASTYTFDSTTYGRGGLCNNTHYYPYVISNGTTVQSLLSTRCKSSGQTLVDLPSGYNYVRQLKFALTTDANRNVMNFQVRNNELFYMLTQGITLNVVTNGKVTTATQLDLSPYVPKIAQRVTLILTGNNPNSPAVANKFYVYIGLSDTSPATGMTVQSVSAYTSVDHVKVPCNYAQVLNYYLSSSTPSITIDVKGYDITEVY